LKTLKATNDYFVERGYDVRKYVKEATTPSDIGAFIHYAFDMITAILPSMAIEEFATIQGMDKRIGEIFFFDFVAGSKKPPFNVGDSYLSSQYGPRAGKYGSYSSEWVNDEDIGNGDGSTTSFNSSLSWIPVIEPSSDEQIVIKFSVGGTDYEALYDGSNIVNDGGNISSININYNSGDITVVFGTPPDDGTTIFVDYMYNSTAIGESDYSGLPEVDVRLTSKLVQAKRRMLKTKWLLDSAAMLTKEHGKDIEKELLDAVIAGVANEIQVEIARDIYMKATGGEVSFSNTPPSTQIPYVFHRQELLGAVINADTMIESKVRKIKANFVIGGAKFSNVVKGLPRDIFEPADYGDTPPVGLHVIGKFYNQYKVIQNFDYPSDAFLVGAKGNSWLYTGYVYAPFIPLMTTKPITDENLVTWRSLLTYYGKKMVNSDFFVRGKITD